jgi:hypothetical protein
MNGIETLRQQMLDWHDLSLSYQMAVDDTWAEHGLDAARLFLMGA